MHTSGICVEYVGEGNIFACSNPIGTVLSPRLNDLDARLRITAVSAGRYYDYLMYSDKYQNVLN